MWPSWHSCQLARVGIHDSDLIKKNCWEKRERACLINRLKDINVRMLEEMADDRRHSGGPNDPAKRAAGLYCFDGY
jgi:hypothetical protein